MSFGLNPLCPMADEVQHLFSCFSRSDSSSARGLRQSFLEDLSVTYTPHANPRWLYAVRKDSPVSAACLFTFTKFLLDYEFVLLCS